MEKSALLLAELKLRRDRLNRLIEVMEGASKEARGGKYAHPAVVPKEKPISPKWLRLEADIDRVMEEGEGEDCWSSVDLAKKLMKQEEYAGKQYRSFRTAVLYRLRAMERAGFVEVAEKFSRTEYYRLVKSS